MRPSPARRAPSRSGVRFRIAALVLPVLLVLVDAGSSVGTVAQGRRCTADCYAGALVLPFAPTVAPILLSGVADEDAHPGTVAVGTAYAVVLATTIAWWWFLGGILASVAARMTRRRTTGKRAAGSWAVFAGLLFSGWALTLAIRIPILVLYELAGAWGLVPVEAVIVAAVVWVTTRRLEGFDDARS